jgi:hypothetical protein
MNISVDLLRRASFALGAVVAALGVVACGSSTTTSSRPASSAAATPSASTTGRGSGFRNPAQRAKLVACLKQHGVTLPSRPPAGAPGSGSGGSSSSGSGTTGQNGAPPGAGSGGRRRGFFFGGGGGAAANPKVQAALKACGVDFRPGPGRLNPAARKAEVNKFVTCVRQHGYNLPKPNFSGHGGVFPSKIQSDPKFQAASKACASLLRPPGAPRGGAGGGGAPPPPSA